MHESDSLQSDPRAPSPAPGRSRWRSWGLGLVSLLVLALSWSCGVAVGRWGGDAGLSQSGLRPRLWDGSEKAEKTIVVLPIEGMILETMGQGGTVSQVSRRLKAIEKDSSVVGVLLAIDTPGGGVTASDRIYQQLLDFKERTKLPVHAIFYDVSASGGYYIAMAADHITAHPTTITGSIGVISKFYNVTEAMEKVGVSVQVIKSLDHRGQVSFKDMGSPFRPMTEAEKKLIQGLVTEMWERFTQVVVRGRADHLTREQVQELADGRIFTGAQAKELKLVDAIGYQADAFRTIREAAKAPDAKIVSWDNEPDWKEMLGLELSWPTSMGAWSAPAIQAVTEQGGFLYLWTAGGFAAMR